MSTKNDSNGKRTIRDRYYSSMNHEEYSLLFGPPAPIVQPLDDPEEFIPVLSLEEDSLEREETLVSKKIQLIDLSESSADNSSSIANRSLCKKMETDSRSVETKASNQLTQNSHPNQQRAADQQKSNALIRSRCMSDCSEFLFFNFLDRINKNAKKKVKLQ